MEKHPKAGLPVLIENGKFKGQYFKVIDYFVNQYQGKAIEKLAKTQGQLLSPVVMRGYPLDDKIVFGQLYPNMVHICVHDLELTKIKAPLKLVEGEQENDSGTTSTGDNQIPVTGESGGTEGRSISSTADIPKIDGSIKGKGKTTRTTRGKTE